jgi:NAD(P)-dependent dehydrogenase (short-subunit alcohol dehydrogenase family)
MDINSAVALVTGGTSGLGLATTKRLLNAGALIVALDLRWRYPHGSEVRGPNHGGERTALDGVTSGCLTRAVPRDG